MNKREKLLNINKSQKERYGKPLKKIFYLDKAAKKETLKNMIFIL